MLAALLKLKPRDVPVRVALRNTLAVVLPLLAGVWLDQMAAGLAMSSGALNTMFIDQPGPYALRMQRMLLAALAAGLAAAAGILIGEHAALMLPAVFVVGMVGGMLVALGPMAARVGLTSIIVFLLCTQLGLAHGHALPIALLTLAGGLLQMLFAIVAWPLQRYRPERFALAQILQQLAFTARSRPDSSQPSPTLQSAQDALLLLHGSHRARGMALDAFRIMAEQCERTRQDLLSLVDVHARLTAGPPCEAIEALLEHAARVLDDLAIAMRDAAPPSAAVDSLRDVEPLVAGIRQSQASIGGRDKRLLRIAEARADSLAGQLRALARNAEWASSRGQIRAEKMEARLPPALRPNAPWATLKANIGLSSMAFRHALRCSLCLVVAVMLAHALAIPHGIWIAMTAAIVLKPDFGGTLSFGALRVVGTLAGLLLMSLLAHLAMDGMLVRIFLLGLMCMGFRLLAQVNYALGVAFLTGMIVLLLSFQGIPPGQALETRIVATLLGSGLAMLAYALWPSWEGPRIRASLARLLDAYRRHLVALFAGRLEQLPDTRGAVRAARTNAQASLDRLRAEPRRGDNRQRAELVESLLANASRLMRAPLSLEAMLREGATMPRLPALDAFVATMDAHLASLVAELEQEGTGRKPFNLPSLRPDERRLAEALDAAGHDDAVTAALRDACDRITNSINTLAHLLRRSSERTG